MSRKTTLQTSVRLELSAMAGTGPRESGARAATKLFYAHAGARSGVRSDEKYSRFFARCSKHHAFGHAELHLARREICDHHGELAFQFLGRVRRLDAREHRARAQFANLERELEQLVRAF